MLSGTSGVFLCSRGWVVLAARAALRMVLAQTWLEVGRSVGSGVSSTKQITFDDDKVYSTRSKQGW